MRPASWPRSRSPGLDVGAADRRWLDLCAGPGGKARLLAGLAAGAGRPAARRRRRACTGRGWCGRDRRPRAAGVIVADGTAPAWRPGVIRPGDRRRPVLRPRRAAQAAGGPLAQVTGGRGRRSAACSGDLLASALDAARAGRRGGLRDVLPAYLAETRAVVADVLRRAGRRGGARRARRARGGARPALPRSPTAGTRSSGRTGTAPTRHLPRAPPCHPALRQARPRRLSPQGYGVRDIGALLGLSYQRAQQLTQ